MITQPTVVYVHGNGNKLAKDALKEKWDRILYGSDQGDLTRMAYFADIHYPFPLPHEASPGVDEKALESFSKNEPEPIDEYRLELLAELQDELGDLTPNMPDSQVSDQEVNNWTNNNHSIDGYLDKHEARDAIDLIVRG